MAASSYTYSQARGSAALGIYFQEISKVALLTPEKEAELARKRRVKGPEGARAFEQLVTANLRFVVSVARKYQNRGLTLDDLINEGNLGLIKAAERFDETRGYKFISYAVWWIRQSILKALAEQSHIVRRPSEQRGIAGRIGRKSSELEQMFEREPTAEELADALDMTVADLSNAIMANERTVSVDAGVNDESDTTVLDLMVCHDEPPPDQQLITESLRAEIRRALTSLSERESRILCLYFGLDCDEPLTIDEISRQLRMPREHIRQIKEKAIRRLRHTSRSQGLRVFVEE